MYFLTCKGILGIYNYKSLSIYLYHETKNFALHLIELEILINIINIIINFFSFSSLRVPHLV